MLRCAIVAALALMLTVHARAQTRFSFDASNAGNFGAQNIQFSRPVPTIDPFATPVGPDTPRFDRPVLLPSISEPTLNPIGTDTYADGLLIASGVDRDGVTPLMVYLHYDDDWTGGAQQTLYVFSGGDLPATWNPVPAPHFSRPLTTRIARAFVQTTPCSFQPPFFPFADLFSGEYQTPSGAPKAFRVFDGAVFHGAIVLAGAVYVYNGSASPPGYEIRGWGFAISNDRGQTWSLIGDDVHEPSLPADQTLWPRGSGCCLRVAPVGQRGSAHPTDCWFSSADYRRNDCGAGAQAGRAFIFRISRPDSGSDWTAGPVKYFELTDTLTHIHTCQVTDYGAAGLQMVASIGDTQAHNRFVRWVLPDTSLDYTDDASWAPPPLSTDNYHGAHADAAQGLPGSLSSQPVSAAFGPTPGSIIWSTDTCAEWLSLMQLPLSGSGQAAFHHLYGMAASAGSADPTDSGNHFSPVCGPIRDPSPELGGPALSLLEADGATSNPNNFALVRLLYCPSIGQAPTQWTQIAGLHAGSVSAAIYGGRIYYTSEIAQFGLWSIPVPQTRTFQPILAAPGGVNLVEGGSFMSVAGLGTIEPLQPGASPGQWLDHGRIVNAPVLSDRVFRIRSDRSSGSNVIATVKQSITQEHGSGGAWAEPQLAWYGGRDRYQRPIDRVRRIRAWLLDATYNDGTPGFGTTPNKTSMLTLCTRAGDTPVNATNCTVKYSCDDRWCPMTIIAHRSIQTTSQSPGLGLWLDTAGVDSNDMYFALDQAMDGAGSLSYPMSAQAPGAGAPVRSPDELLSVASLGLSCGGDWMMRLAGMQPTGNWDHYSDRGSQSDGEWESNRTWPLFTLWADAETYIEFSADCEGRGFRVKLKTSSGPALTASFGDGLQVWLPESPLLVAVAYDASQHAFYIGASLGGDRVRTTTIPAFFSSPATLTFDTLRFSGSGGGRYGTRPEVVEYRWIGGEATTTPPPILNEVSLRSAFTDLSFLGGR